MNVTSSRAKSTRTVGPSVITIAANGRDALNARMTRLTGAADVNGVYRGDVEVYNAVRGTDKAAITNLWIDTKSPCVVSLRDFKKALQEWGSFIKSQPASR